MVSLQDQILYLFAEGESLQESPQLHEDGSVHYCGKIALILLYYRLSRLRRTWLGPAAREAAR
jgi:hypothetical protein